MSSSESLWTPPEFLDQSDVDRLGSEPGIRVFDASAYISKDLFEMRHGRNEVDPVLAKKEKMELSEYVEESSKWVYFHWNGKIVRYPSLQDHYDIRTWRNKNLILAEEQERLGELRIATIGMSVGSNINDQLVQSGIGGDFLFADKDTLSPSNLNRITAEMADVGLKKTVIMGRKISATDPYLGQLHLPDGYVGQETDSILEDWRPDVIFDEVDNLVVKAQLRRVAQRLCVPLLMMGDIDKKPILDIERYDIDPEVKPFNGKISSEMYERLLEDKVAPEEVLGLLVALNGEENISERLFASATNPDLGGLPQRGSTAKSGASLSAIAIEAIFLDALDDSGTYTHDPKTGLGLSKI